MLVSAGRFFFFFSFSSSCTRESTTRTLRSIRLVVDAHCRARYLTAIRSFVLPQEFSPFPSLCSSPFLSLALSLSLSLSLSLHECRSPSPFQRVPSVILSGCITYRAIECPDHDLGTRAPIRSNHSIILSPCNAPRCTPAQEA